MNPFDLTEGVDFDRVAPNIRVRADRAGAEVFTLKNGTRVLAHSKEDAQRAVSELIPDDTAEAIEHTISQVKVATKAEERTEIEITPLLTHL